MKFGVAHMPVVRYRRVSGGWRKDFSKHMKKGKSEEESLAWLMKKAHIFKKEIRKRVLP